MTAPSVIRLGRNYRFFAAHRLHNHSLTDAENARIYGKCNHPNGHGHTYNVTVVVEGRLDPVTAMIVDLDDLDNAVATVLERVSHRHLDRDIPFFRQYVSTSERIAQYLYRRLGEALDPLQVTLARLEVGETRNNHFEIERSAG